MSCVKGTELKCVDSHSESPPHPPGPFSAGSSLFPSLDKIYHSSGYYYSLHLVEGVPIYHSSGYYFSLHLVEGVPINMRIP